MEAALHRASRQEIPPEHGGRASDLAAAPRGAGRLDSVRWGPPACCSSDPGSVPSPRREKGKSPAQSLHFTFVDIPDDEAAEESPRARLLSDRTRSPASRSRPPRRQGSGARSPFRGELTPSQIARIGPRRACHTSPPPPARAAAEGGRPRRASAKGARAGEGGRTSRRWTGAGGGGEEGGSGNDDLRQSFRKALQQLSQGPTISAVSTSAYAGRELRDPLLRPKGSNGGLCRQLYLIIKKNWYDRIPIAAYYARRGRSSSGSSSRRTGASPTCGDTILGDLSFDRAAENAIRASNPLPPLPANFPKEREGVTFGFFYNLPIDQP